jgi:hypothetical protein
MNIIEVLDQVRELLRSKGRVTYRILKRQFGLDDEALEDIKAELIKADRVARDEDGEVLVWVGDGAAALTQPLSPPPRTPPTPSRAYSRRTSGHGIAWRNGRGAQNYHRIVC